MDGDVNIFKNLNGIQIWMLPNFGKCTHIMRGNPNELNYM